jgi:hypothetical protein
MKNHVIKFVSDLWQVGVSSNTTDSHDITELMLKVALECFTRKVIIKCVNTYGTLIYYHWIMIFLHLRTKDLKFEHLTMMSGEIS